MRPAHPCISRARRQIGIQTPTTPTSSSRPSLVLIVAIMGQVSALLCVVSALVSLPVIPAQNALSPCSNFTTIPTFSSTYIHSIVRAHGTWSRTAYRQTENFERVVWTTGSVAPRPASTRLTRVYGHRLGIHPSQDCIRDVQEQEEGLRTIFRGLRLIERRN